MDHGVNGPRESKPNPAVIPDRVRVLYGVCMRASATTIGGETVLRSRFSVSAGPSDAPVGQHSIVIG